MQDIPWKIEMTVAVLAVLLALVGAYIAFQHRPTTG
jgi:hypothetical protein